MIRREPATFVLVLVVFSLLALFVVYPLGKVAAACVTGPDGGFTLEHIRKIFTRWHFVRPILNSVLLGAIVAVAGTAVGFLLASPRRAPTRRCAR